MRKTEATDSELLAEWLKHQRESASHEIVSRYAGLVHATARRTCGDESLAGEATQLTFILLARKARSLGQHASLAGWLHCAAILQTKNLIRQTRCENRKRQQLAMGTPSHPHNDTWHEMQPVIDDALASLSENDREALLLRFYRSLTIREVAANLGIATDAAQKRIDRATERLRGKLVRRGVQTGGSLSAAMLAGFAVDAQAAALPVSLLASKAIAAGAVSS
jgi:RNA polymerase sigma factor (sigma-70 family)